MDEIKNGQAYRSFCLYQPVTGDHGETWVVQWLGRLHSQSACENVYKWRQIARKV